MGDRCVKQLAAWLLVLSISYHPASSIVVEAARVESRSGLTIAYLSGTPEEIGLQHGTLLREQVRASVRQVLGYFRRYLKVPLVRSWIVNWWLDRSWAQAWPSVSPAVRAELQGLAKGSGVPLRELYRLHAVPDRTYSCANFAAWGQATAGGRLIHVRNLDWNIRAGIQRHPVVFVVRPRGKRAFVSVGWAGIVGVLTGVNDAQVSIGQIGAETTDTTFRGEPMVLLMRRVMEEAADVDQAAAIIREARRTVGVNYVIADAKAPRALALETTRSAFRAFEADDPAEHAVAYAKPIPCAVVRADTAIDPGIRERQLASRGDPRRPGLEPPGGSAYETRYLGQAAGIMASFGTLDEEAAKDIAAKVAPDSNVQSVVFAWPSIWVANAQGTIPAARTDYHHLDLPTLFSQPLD